LLLPASTQPHQSDRLAVWLHKLQPQTSIVCAVVSSAGPVRESAGTTGSDAIPLRCLFKMAAAAENTKRSLKITQLDPLGNSFRIQIKNSSSLPLDMMRTELVNFMRGVDLLDGAHNLLNLGTKS